jgi:SAM-dependent methyltransferase
MSDPPEKQPGLPDFIQAMKRDWDARARENAKWFINTLKLQQSEEEFDRSGEVEIGNLVLPDLAFITQGRDPQRLRVLEIGCGIGRMTRHLAGLFGEICASDVSAEMLKQAQERLRAFDNVRFYETNGCDFAGLPSDYFDFAISVYVYQHVPSADVIRANLADGYRTLKPGGVFKFHTNGVIHPAFVEVEKGTWAGAAYPETEIRRLARELGAQLISIFGAGTQYCWTTLRKRQQRASNLPPRRPQIESYGWSEDLRIKEIPLSSDQACLALAISGLAPEEVDANNLMVRINDRVILPRYAGPVRLHLVASLQAEFGRSLDHLIYAEAEIPRGEPSGPARICVQFGNEEASAPITVELGEPQHLPPRIVLIRNGSDGGLDVYARGPKSSLVVQVHGLGETADVGNVRLQVGEHIIQPGYVGFVPRNAAHQINVQLPENIGVGEFETRLYFGNISSPSVLLSVKAPEPE